MVALPIGEARGAVGSSPAQARRSLLVGPSRDDRRRPPRHGPRSRRASTRARRRRGRGRRPSDPCRRVGDRRRLPQRARADATTACWPRSCRRAMSVNSAVASPPPRSSPASRSFAANCGTRAAKAGLRAMSIPIDPSRAVGGRLAAGDRIDVLFAGDREVSIIVRDAEVIAIDAKGRGGIGETSSPFTVTIAVDARQSQLACGGDCRRRHLARTNHRRAVVAGHRAPGARRGRRSCRHRARRGPRGTHDRAGLLPGALGRTTPSAPHRPRRRACSPDRARTGAGAGGRVRHARRQSPLAGAHAIVRRRGAPPLALCARRLRSRRSRGPGASRRRSASTARFAPMPPSRSSSRCSRCSRRCGSPTRVELADRDPAVRPHRPDRRQRARGRGHERSRARPRRRNRGSRRGRRPRRRGRARVVDRRSARPRDRAQSPQRHRRGRARPRRTDRRAGTYGSAGVRRGLRAAEPRRGRPDPTRRRARGGRCARPTSDRTCSSKSPASRMSRSLERWSATPECSSASVPHIRSVSTRLLGWAAALPAGVAPVHLVLNRAPTDRYQRAELTGEIYRTFTPASLTFVPSDRRVERAAWTGELVPRGPFTTGVAALAQTAVPRGSARPARRVERRARRTSRVARERDHMRRAA